VPGRAALVTALILDRPLCEPGLASKSRLSPAALEETLTNVRTALKLHETEGRCRDCGETTRVLSLERPAQMPSPRDHALWEYLERHHGEMFCTGCLAHALGMTKRIDRSVIVAEGRGARRYHGPCATCGKPRLLCGLV
jgi:hypothetical protein